MKITKIALPLLISCASLAACSNFDDIRNDREQFEKESSLLDKKYDNLEIPYREYYLKKDSLIHDYSSRVYNYNLFDEDLNRCFIENRALNKAIENAKNRLEEKSFDNNISVPNTNGVNSVNNYSQAQIANIPKIDNNYIQYKNMEGKVKKVGIVDNATISLYKAIQKYSNNSNPDITDIGSFYASVESNIPKNEVPNNCITRRGQIMDNTESANKTIRHQQCSQLFNKLFDIFTSPKSEKGDTITVNEYTKMMDAWSSTGK